MTDRFEKGAKFYKIEERVCTPEDVDKPCTMIGECPYGAFVEYFPLHAEFEGQNLNEVNLNTGYNCDMFGHDCPIFYFGMVSDKKTERMTEGMILTLLSVLINFREAKLEDAIKENNYILQQKYERELEFFKQTYMGFGGEML